MSESETVQELTKKVAELTKIMKKKKKTGMSATEKYHKSAKGIIARNRATKVYYAKIKKKRNETKIKHLEIEQYVLERRVEDIKNQIIKLST